MLGKGTCGPSNTQSLFTYISLPETNILRSHPQYPLEDIPDVSPTVYEGFPFFVGFWGSLGYLPRIMWAKSLKHSRSEDVLEMYLRNRANNGNIYR